MQSAAPDKQVRAERAARPRFPMQVLEKYALLGAWAIVVAIFGFLEPGTFLSLANLTDILGSQAVLVVLALSLIAPLTAGDYDLSVAATLTLSAMVVAVLNAQDGVALGVAVLAAIGVGVVAGLVNGALVVSLGIDSLIVTLGTSTIMAGIVLWISGSLTISGISENLVNVVIGFKIAGVPLEFFYGLILAGVFWYFLEYVPTGRRLLFVGRGRNVARLSGVNVGRMRLGAMVASGAIASLAGILYAGTSGSADPSSGLSLLLPAFAAVFLGSTTLKPGRFNSWGTFIAVYFLVTGITGLQLLGLQAFVQQLFYGAGLIGGVALRQILRRGESTDAE